MLTRMSPPEERTPNPSDKQVPPATLPEPTTDNATTPPPPIQKEMVAATSGWVVVGFTPSCDPTSAAELPKNPYYAPGRRLAEELGDSFPTELSWKDGRCLASAFAWPALFHSEKIVRRSLFITPSSAPGVVGTYLIESWENLLNMPREKARALWVLACDVVTMLER